jgi:FKBP-type peptidyl-prolyl cis-trans isomerase (trigger factor)
LAGKKALFDVEIVQCSKRTVPEVNDEFAEKVKAGLTSESLLAELRKAIDEEDSKDFVPARNAALGKALATRVEVDVPDTLITNQAREKFAVMMAEMRDNGVADDVIKQQINPDNFAKYKAIVKDDIVRDFKVSMATDEIARLEGITVPDYQIEEQMEAIRKDADGSEDFDENMIRMKVETTLQRQLVMELLAKESQLQVSYEDDKFDEKLLEQLAQDTLKAVEADAVIAPSTPTVVDVVAEPIVKEQPVVAKAVEKTKVVEKAPTEEPIEIKGEMSLQEKAFAALFNAGAVKIHKSPDDPEYDSSNDDKEAPENKYVN